MGSNGRGELGVLDSSVLIPEQIVGAPSVRLDMSIAALAVVVSLTGNPGAACEIQSSSNIRNWIVLTNVTLGSDGTAEFVDTRPAQGSRFYRGREQ